MNESGQQRMEPANQSAPSARSETARIAPTAGMSTTRFKLAVADSAAQLVDFVRVRVITLIN